MAERHSPGEILLASLVFTSQARAKKRPVMVIRDAGDDDLLVVPVRGAGRAHRLRRDSQNVPYCSRKVPVPHYAGVLPSARRSSTNPSPQDG